jgi:hypothetical protein
MGKSTKDAFEENERNKKQIITYFFIESSVFYSKIKENSETQ